MWLAVGQIGFMVSPMVEAETKLPEEGLKPPSEGFHSFSLLFGHVVVSVAVLATAFQSFSQKVSETGCETFLHNGFTKFHDQFGGSVSSMRTPLQDWEC
jgi:hypothetical protein